MRRLMDPIDSTRSGPGSYDNPFGRVLFSRDWGANAWGDAHLPRNAVGVVDEWLSQGSRGVVLRTRLSPKHDKQQSSWSDIHPPRRCGPSTSCCACKLRPRIVGVGHPLRPAACSELLVQTPGRSQEGTWCGTLEFPLDRGLWDRH